jgi:predicted aspartyl protease
MSKSERDMRIGTAARALLAGMTALAIGLLPGSVASADPQCQLQQIESLDLDTGGDGTITVPVSIENHPAKLMIDTGAAFSVVDESFARSVGLEPRFMGPGISMTLGGGIPLTQIVTTRSLRLGRLIGLRFTFIVAPSRVLTPETMGMIGPDVLSSYDAEIDFAGGKLNIFSQDHCPGHVVYWTQAPYAAVPMKLDDNRHITIPVMLDGKPLTAVADTGAARSFMSFQVAKEIFGLDEKNPALKSLGVFGINNVAAEQLFHYPFQSLTFEGIEIRNPDIAITKGSDADKDDPQLVIGIGVLRQLHMYIAYKEQVLYLTPAEAR